MNRHEELAAFLEGLCDNPEEGATAIERQAQECEIVRALVKHRNLIGLSQRQLAKRAGLTQSKVQRMEAGTDADLRWGDLSAYMKGLGVSASVDLQPTAESGEDGKRRLILKIGGLLDELREVARRDGAADSLLAGISAFRGDVLLSLIGSVASEGGVFPTIRLGAPQDVPAPEPVAALV